MKLVAFWCTLVYFTCCNAQTEDELIETYRTHMLFRKSVSANLNAALTAASVVAEQTFVDETKRVNIFAYQGNIYDVQDEVSFYAQAARLPGVYNIGEIGFNAGHSSITFLWQNQKIHLTSFDLGEMTWTPASVRLVARMYPGRFTYIKGLSTTVVPQYLAENSSRPLFDLFAIDGGHNGDVPYMDMKNGRAVTKRGGFVLIDDWTDTNIDVKNAWARAKREGFIKEILCADPKQVVFGAQKAYCVGLYL